MQYLTFDLSDDTAGVATLEALAATTADQHPAVMAEVQLVLDWAWQHFGSSHGPVSLETDNDWDHDLQLQLEPGGWHAVTLTLTASARFAEAFFDRFGYPGE